MLRFRISLFVIVFISATLQLTAIDLVIIFISYMVWIISPVFSTVIIGTVVICLSHLSRGPAVLINSVKWPVITMVVWTFI